MFGRNQKVIVQCIKGGPIIIRGEIVLCGEDGAEISTSRLTSLCRCGRSAAYPLCDGSHAKTSDTGE